MIDLSIIIISYNTKKITKKCLETVGASLKYDPKISTEIIVVDNASTDGTVSSISALADKIIENHENLGFARANNQGAEKAQGEYLLFLNSDIEIIDDALPNLYNFFTKQNEFQFVGGKLLNRDLTSQASCGPMFTLPVIFGFLFLRGDYYGLTRYSPDQIKRVDWVSGACIMTKKEYFNKAKGFDEAIFMYMEEIEFFYRVATLNFKVGFFPRSKFIHLGSASSRDKANPILQVYKGFIYFYKKHKSPLHLFILIIMLKLKARLCILLGKIFNKVYLVETYEKALETTRISR